MSGFGLGVSLNFALLATNTGFRPVCNIRVHFWSKIPRFRDARIPGCDRPCNASKTARLNDTGTNGRFTPADVSAALLTSNMLYVHRKLSDIVKMSGLPWTLFTRGGNCFN